MKNYKEPDFQSRVAAAALARDAALTRYRARPTIDPAVAAARAAASQARDAARAEKQRADRQAWADEKAARRVKAAEAAAVLAAPPKPEQTEAERKAARDARYLARKNRGSA